MTQTFHCSSHSPSTALHARVCACMQVRVCAECLPLFMYCNHCACSRASPGSQQALSFFLPVYLTCCRALYLRSLLLRGCSRQPRVQGRIKHHRADGDTRHTTRGCVFFVVFFKNFILSLVELQLSCLDSSCDPLSGHEMNSQVWLNNRELQSAAALHPSVLGRRHQRL